MHRRSSPSTRSHPKSSAGGDAVHYTMNPLHRLDRPQSAYACPAIADADLDVEHISSLTRISHSRRKLSAGSDLDRSGTLQHAISSPALQTPGQILERPTSAIPGSTGAGLFDIASSAPLSLGKGLLRGFTSSGAGHNFGMTVDEVGEPAWMCKPRTRLRPQSAQPDVLGEPVARSKSMTGLRPQSAQPEAIMQLQQSALLGRPPRKINTAGRSERWPRIQLPPAGEQASLGLWCELLGPNGGQQPL
jgi:hypothetical protein